MLLQDAAAVQGQAHAKEYRPRDEGERQKICGMIPVPALLAKAVMNESKTLKLQTKVHCRSCATTTW